MITGAGSGIGAATAICFVALGASVVLVDRRGEKLEETIARINQPDRVAILPGDVREQEIAEAAIRMAVDQFGGLDIVVNNAAVAYPVEFPDAPLDEWREIFDVILVGAFRFCREAATAMIAKGTAGRIVNVTSVHGTLADPKASGYGSAKAAVNQLTRCLAVELAPHNIRVNAVAPGFVDTPMSIRDGVNELESEWYRKFYVENRRLPMARAGQPEEIASVILFLAGPDSSYVTGHVLVADGGLTCTL